MNVLLYSDLSPVQNVGLDAHVDVKLNNFCVRGHVTGYC